MAAAMATAIDTIEADPLPLRPSCDTVPAAMA